MPECCLLIKGMKWNLSDNYPSLLQQKKATTQYHEKTVPVTDYFKVDIYIFIL